MRHPPSEIDLGVALVATHEQLAQAKDPGEALLAVAGTLSQFGPQSLDLSLTFAGADGQVEDIEIVRAWRGGQLLAEYPLFGVRMRLADFELGARLLANPSEPMVLVDVAADPAVASVLGALPWGVRSAVVLPLYSRRHAEWQGMLCIHWTERHEPSPAELLVYRLLLHTISEAFAGERALRELRATLAEKNELLQTTERTLAESRAQQTMLGFLLDNLPVGVNVFHGATGEQELCNHAGSELLNGRVSDVIVGYTPLFYRPGEREPLPQSDWPFTRALQTGTRQTQEMELERPDGSRLLLDVTAMPLRYEGDPAPRIVILYQDITATRSAQREQLAAQEELLRTQAQALAERSSPLIPIRDDVLVMPLVGSIDAERGRQILEALVHLGGAARVRAAIIDVTGAKNLDAAAAHALIAAARALRLRGVQPVVTGIQQAAALTLVELGVDFSGILVRATLQDGVEAALRSSG